MQNLKGGRKFAFPKMFDSFRELFLTLKRNQELFFMYICREKNPSFIQCHCALRYSMAFLVNDRAVILLAMREVTFYSKSALQSFPLE